MYIKILHPDGRCYSGGKGKWHLPIKGKPGKWMPPVEHVSLCDSGYHLTDFENARSFISSCPFAVFEAEGRGVRTGDLKTHWKVAFQKARLVKKLFSVTSKQARRFILRYVEEYLNAIEHSKEKKYILSFIKNVRKALRGEKKLKDVLNDRTRNKLRSMWCKAYSDKTMYAANRVLGIFDNYLCRDLVRQILDEKMMEYGY